MYSMTPHISQRTHSCFRANNEFSGLIGSGPSRRYRSRSFAASRFSSIQVSMLIVFFRLNFAMVIVCDVPMTLVCATRTCFCGPVTAAHGMRYQRGAITFAYAVRVVTVRQLLRTRCSHLCQRGASLLPLRYSHDPTAKAVVTPRQKQL